jgi:hypothetical protein
MISPLAIPTFFAATNTQERITAAQQQDQTSIALQQCATMCSNRQLDKTHAISMILKNIMKRFARTLRVATWGCRRP